MTQSRFFWILSATLVIVFIIILGYREQSINISPSFKESTMQKLQMTHKKDNKIKWELLARNASFPVDKKEILLQSIGLTINHSPKIYITSKSGIYEIENENITLSEAVELHTEDTKFTTDTLNWNGKDELITTEDDVKFSGKTFLIEGKGLAAETSRQRVRILKDVKAVFYH
jgi:LPS export ABC transporter protein LptC